MKKYFFSLIILLAMICTSSYSMQNQYQDIDLVSKDGQIVGIVRHTAEISQLLKDMLEEKEEDAEETPRIPVPAVNFKELDLIVRFMGLERYYKRNEHKNDLQIRESFARLLKSMAKWRLTFEDIKLLLEAAAYLGCENILQSLVYYIIDRDPTRFLDPKLLALTIEEEKELVQARLKREQELQEEPKSPEEEPEIGSWKSVEQMMEEEREERKRQEDRAKELFDSIFATFGFSYYTYRDLLKPYIIKIIETRIPHYVRENAHKRGFNAWVERVEINPRARQLIRETIQQIITQVSQEGRQALERLLATIEEDGVFKDAVVQALGALRIGADEREEVEGEEEDEDDGEDDEGGGRYLPVRPIGAQPLRSPSCTF